MIIPDLVEKIENMGKILDQMQKDGWLPVTPERQRYHVTLDFDTHWIQAGFVVVELPVFQVEGRGKFYVKTVRYPGVLKATDRPEDLPKFNAEMIVGLVEYAKKLQFTHIHTVVVSRSELYGYVAPEVFIAIRGARVR